MKKTMPFRRTPQPFLRRWCLIALGTLAILSSGYSSSAAQTINEILSRNKLVVGVLVDFPPFGIMNSDQKPDGFDADLARLIAKNLGVELELVPVANANRIPFLQSKRVDILVASLGITPERAKQVMFTIPYTVTGVAVAAPKKIKIDGIKGLSGIRVAIARGSSQETYLSEMAPKDCILMRFDGDGSAFQAVSSGQADAFAGSVINIAAFAKANPDLELETKVMLREQGNAIALRLDAFELKQYLNTIIYIAKTTGDLDAINRKWLGVPLPPLPSF